MAQKRMFSKQIVNSDAFMDMPQSSQLLYFHLAMEADDDGFIGNPKKIMRGVGSSGDDYKLLMAKRFVLSFPEGICVIKHWLIHNYIQSDRYKETKYIEQKNKLLIKENKAYTENKDGEGIKQIEETNLPFSLKDEIQKLYDNKRRDLNILGLYFEYRQPKFENHKQYQIALKRHLKPAGELSNFSDNQIIDAIEYAKKEYKDIYTCETLLKILTK